MGPKYFLSDGKGGIGRSKGRHLGQTTEQTCKMLKQQRTVKELSGSNHHKCRANYAENAVKCYTHSFLLPPLQSPSPIASCTHPQAPCRVLDLPEAYAPLLKRYCQVGLIRPACVHRMHACTSVRKPTHLAHLLRKRGERGARWVGSRTGPGACTHIVMRVTSEHGNLRKPGML